MLGHKVWQACRQRFDTWATVRSRTGLPEDLFDSSHLVSGVDAAQLDSVVGVLATVRPDAVVNCVGIVKQSPTADEPVPSLVVNALFPHRVAELCRATGSRLIHISTDCVFSGRKGGYLESDQSDAQDLYGRTKLLGEVASPPALTLRTSMIGRELTTAHGLLEWFLSQRGRSVRGFAQALFSGPTTNELARIIGHLLERFPDLTGVYHVSADPIDKYELLCRLNAAYGSGTRIERSDELKIDRSLDSTRFRNVTGWVAPSWDSMIQDLAADPTPYSRWRSA